MPVAPELMGLRPKLRQDTAFLLSGDVTYVRNGDGAAVVKGRSAYRWLVTLARYLTGELTVEQLCRDLPESQQETIAALVSLLLEQGFARHVEPEPPDVLPERVRERFAAQLQYVDHFASEPAARFAALRTSNVLLVGGGEALLAAGGALLRNGLSRLSVAPANTSSEVAPVVRALAEEAAVLTAQGCPAEVRLLDWAGAASTGSAGSAAAGDGLAGSLAAMHMVAYCADDCRLDEVYEINRRCHRAGVPFLPLVVFAGRAVIGPVGRRRGPCWTCALLRITTNADPVEAAAAWREIAVPSLPRARRPLPSTTARMLGNGVGFEIFAQLIGHIPGEVESGIVIQDLDTLFCTRESLVAHPLCPVCADCPDLPSDALGPTIEALAVDAPSVDIPSVDVPSVDAPTAEQLYEYSERLFGRHAGPLREFVDEPLTQVPLKVGSVRLGDPRCLAPASDVTAFDVDDLRAARNAATALALTAYAQRAFDPGRAIEGSVADLEIAGRHPVPPAGIITWSGAGSARDDERLHWVAGHQLDDGQACLVPAGAVYPGSRLNTGLRWERTSAGLATAESSPRAAGLGLISSLAHARLRDLVRGNAALVELDGERVGAADRRLGFLIRSAGHLGCRVRLLEALGAGGVHVHLAACDGAAEPTWAIGSGQSGPEAALAALTTLVGRLQLPDVATGEHEDQLMADLTPLAELRFADPATSRFDAPRDSLADLHQQVSLAGLTAVFVDMTPPDVAGTGPLRVCRVLLVDRVARTARSTGQTYPAGTTSGAGSG